MTPKQRRYLIEVVAEENEATDPIDWPKSATYNHLRGYSDMELLADYGYLLEPGELEAVK